MRKIEWLLVLLSVPLVLWSCQSGENTQAGTGSVRDINIETIKKDASLERRIEESIIIEPIPSLSRLHKYVNNKLITPEQFKKYEALTISEIKKKVRQLYLNKNYTDSILYASAYQVYTDFYKNKSIDVTDTAGATDTTSSTTGDVVITSEDQESKEVISRFEIIKNIIMNAHENNNFPLAQKYALDLYQESREYFVNNKIFEQVEDELQSYRYKAFIDMLCTEKDFSNLEKVSTWCKDAPVNSLSQMLDSTFVIDIDKGVSKDGINHEIGSAFFITKDGYALTNHHVINSEVSETYKGKSEMIVKLREDNYRSRPAKVIGYDPIIDLAIIKVDDIEVENVFSLIGDEDVREGDDITVIGSPLGLANTVTSGIVSSIDRGGLGNIGNILQIDASVNPGNSGGPLLNKDNEVIGVVVAKISGVENINFAIPGRIVLEVLPSLFVGGKSKQSWLGVGGYVSDKGFEILYVTSDSPAEYMDLMVGDIIVSVDGVAIKTIEDFQVKMISKPINSLMHGEIIKYGTHKKEQVLFITSERNQEVLVNRVTKRNFFKIFPVISGTQIEVSNYRFNQPQYRLIKVYEDSPANYFGFTAGDIISIRKLQRRSNYVIIEIRVIQQSRGFLEDILVITLPLNTKNFI